MYIKDNKPYTLRDLRRDHPHTSFPLVLSDELEREYGLVKAREEKPSFNSDWEYITIDRIEGDCIYYSKHLRPDISAYRLSFVRALERLGYLERVYQGLQEYPQYQLWWDHVTIFERNHEDMLFFKLIEIDVDEVFRELF